MRKIFQRSQDEHEEHSALGAVELLVKLDNALTSLGNRGDNKKQIKRDRASAVSASKALQSKSLIEEPSAINDTVGLIVGALSSALVWHTTSPDDRSDASSILQTLLSQLLEIVSPGEMQPTTKSHVAACQQVVRTIPGCEMFTQLLGDDMTFWVKHNAISLVVELLQWDGASFASLLVLSTSLASAVIALLRSSESEVSLLDKAITFLKGITDPNIARQIGEVSDERGIGVFHRVLVFEGVFEEVLRIIRVEGGAMANEREPLGLLPLTVSAERHALLGEIPRCVATAGQLEIVRDCVIVIRQLLHCCPDGIKYFDGNELVIQLCCAVSFDGASRRFFELTGEGVTAPPFFRHVGHPTQDERTSARELLLLEILSVLLAVSAPSQGTYDARALQSFFTSPPGQWSIIDSVACWFVFLTYAQQRVVHAPPHSQVRCHSALLLVVESLLIVLHRAMNQLPQLAQNWLTELQADTRKQQLIVDCLRGFCSLSHLSATIISTNWILNFSIHVLDSGSNSGRARFAAFNALQTYMRREISFEDLNEALEWLVNSEEGTEGDASWSYWIVLAAIFFRVTSIHASHCPTPATQFRVLCKFVILLKTSSCDKTAVLCAAMCLNWMMEAMRRNSLAFDFQAQTCVEAFVHNARTELEGSWTDHHEISLLQTTLVFMCAPQFSLEREHTVAIASMLSQYLPVHSKFVNRDHFLGMVVSGCSEDIFDNASSFDEVREAWLTTSAIVNLFSSSRDASDTIAEAEQDLNDALALTLESGSVVLPISLTSSSTAAVLENSIVSELWSALVRDLVRGPNSLAMHNLQLFFHEMKEAAKHHAVHTLASQISSDQGRQIAELRQKVTEYEEMIARFEQRILSKDKELSDSHERESSFKREIDAIRALLSGNSSMWN
ncbi:Hypothetical protein, putative [Bodo saltans]|uniref:Uncharacterized protein n=1 Tax=Bodo saltans TaxID=75058 RepID=A0A0S4JPD9_BODSA|nr:Hypothetical protein, putative [Bodo saltans]|eukprot:CUG93410.1 Hypothetical protein, putative [Bodo saltans]